MTTVETLSQAKPDMGDHLTPLEETVGDIRNGLRLLMDHICGAKKTEVDQGLCIYLLERLQIDAEELGVIFKDMHETWVATRPR